MRKSVMLAVALILVLGFGICSYAKADKASTYQNTALGFSFKYPAALGKSILQKDAGNKILYYNEKQGVMLFVSPYKYAKASEMKGRMIASGKLVAKKKGYYLYRSTYNSGGTPVEVGEVYTFVNNRCCVTITAAMVNSTLDWDKSSASREVHAGMIQILSTFKFK